MKNNKLIVIGGDAAGMSAASKVRREQPDREIIVFERGNHTSYSACGMPYFIGGQVESAEKLIARRPEVFRKKYNIDVRIRHEVKEIDTANKRVRVTDLDKNKELWESWDDLLIATGASPVVPDIEGIDAHGIFSLSTLQSGIDVFNYIEKEKPSNAVIVGGGYIGIEMAEVLQERSLDITLIDMAPQVMVTMDKDMADIISEHMKEEGIKVLLEEKLSAFEKNSTGKVKSVITDKQTISADLVILGMGVKPNSELAVNAGIKTGAGKAIQVNKRMETSIPNIWAAGDCAESCHLITKKQVNIALGTIANKHGLVAGINISGGNQEFPGVTGTAITKFKDLEISRTGLSETEARDLDIDINTASIESATIAGYYPGAGKISVKLVADKKSGKILGAQIIGAKGAGKRIDTIVTAVNAGMTAQQIVDLDLSYAPPFSPGWDPEQITARRLV
jgi:NADPH-dependent 2,4-dienoyl-CoA reductase/sulfur reductase-like enzyme